MQQIYFALLRIPVHLHENIIKVRKAIADIGGTMPEDLPTPKKSLKELEKGNKLNAVGVARK